MNWPKLSNCPKSGHFARDCRLPRAHRVQGRWEKDEDDYDEQEYGHDDDWSEWDHYDESYEYDWSYGYGGYGSHGGWDESGSNPVSQSSGVDYDPPTVAQQQAAKLSAPTRFLSP